MTDKQIFLWAFGYNPADIAKVDHIPLPTLRNILENIEVCQDDPNYKPVAQDYFRTDYGMVKGPVDLSHAAPEVQKILAEVGAGKCSRVMIENISDGTGFWAHCFVCENGQLNYYREFQNATYRWMPRGAHSPNEALWFDKDGKPNLY